jgi:hypothetical protein
VQGPRRSLAARQNKGVPSALVLIGVARRAMMAMMLGPAERRRRGAAGGCPRLAPTTRRVAPALAPRRRRLRRARKRSQPRLCPQQHSSAAAAAAPTAACSARRRRRRSPHCPQRRLRPWRPKSSLEKGRLAAPASPLHAPSGVRGGAEPACYLLPWLPAYDGVL